MIEGTESAPSNEILNDNGNSDDAGFEVRHHRDHPGHRRHRLGHPVDEQVKVMAHLFEPWENLRANGSGLVAFAAWMDYLEGRGEQGAASTAQRLRGLTHR